MKKDHVILNFIHFPIAQKIETGRNVESLMRPNPLFPNPDVSMDDIKASTDLLESRNVASLSGGKESTALLHQAEENWNKFMRLEALYVERIADGDGAVILSAGFSLAKKPTPAVHPEFKVALGEKSGSVLLRHKRVEGGRAYIWQYVAGDNPAADAAWVTAQVTPQASLELEGLTPLTKYWFRVAVVTIDGTSDYCTPVMQMVI